MVGVWGEGGRQTHCASHSPLPRPVASVKFSANKNNKDKREEKGIRETEMDNRNDWMVSSTDPLTYHYINYFKVE